jgi:hypothetical protein
MPENRVLSMSNTQSPHSIIRLLVIDDETVFVWSGAAYLSKRPSAASRGSRSCAIANTTRCSWT